VNVSGTFNHYFGSPDKLTKLILFVTRVPLILAVFPFLFFAFEHFWKIGWNTEDILKATENWF